MSRWSEADLAAHEAKRKAQGAAYLAQPLGKLAHDAAMAKLKVLKSVCESAKRCRTAALAQLLARPSIVGLRLQPEEALSVAVADRLRALSLEGRLRGTWTHPANEGHPGKLRTAKMLGAKKVAMGMVPGTPDFAFLWATGSGWIELKREGGDTRLAMRKGKLVTVKTRPTQLSPMQELHRDWCQAEGVRWACARSVEGVEETLRGWGALA